jgi:hypothetical protein
VRAAGFSPVECASQVSEHFCVCGVRGKSKPRKRAKLPRSTLTCLGQLDSFASRLPTVARQSHREIEETIAAKPNAA